MDNLLSAGLMKVSFERKILWGYLINILVVAMIGVIYWYVMPFSVNTALHWLSGILILLALVMLTIVFFILKAQLKAKKVSEQALIKHQNLLQSIINNTSSAIYVKKLNGEYLLVNKHYQSLFDSKEKDIVGKTNHEFLSREIADRYRDADLEAVKAETEIKIEETYDHTDGPHTYLSVKFPLFDAFNRVYAIGNISTDITERKAEVESLLAADAFFNMSLDSLVIASRHKFLKINRPFSKLLGYSIPELLEKPFETFIYEEDRAKTATEIDTLLKGNELTNFKNRWICKDGSIKWLSWNATAHPETQTIYAIVKDVTEKLKLEEEDEQLLTQLFESQQKLNLILENISDGVLVANHRKEIILANEVANRLFEIDDDSKISIHFSDHFKVLFPGEDKTFPVQELPAERAFLGEETNDIDVVLIHLKTHEARRVLLSGRPIFDAQQEVAAAVVTIKDISLYKKLEEEMKKRDSDARQLIGFKRPRRTKKK